MAGVPRFRVAEVIAEPAQGKSRSLGDSHHMPFSRDRVAEGVDAPAWVEFGRIGVGEDHAGSAQSRGSQSGKHDAVTHGAGGLVACASHHRCSRAQAGQHRHFPGDFAGDFGRFEGFGQDFRINLQRTEHFGRPPAMGDIKKQSPGSVGNIGGEFPRQAIADEILGKQEVSNALEDLGLIVANPKHFGGAETGKRRVGNVLNKLCRSHLVGDPIALRLAALIAPDQRGAQHRPGFVEQHHAVHLPGKSHRGNFRAFYAGLLEGGADGHQCRLPPVFRVLFSPTRPVHAHGLVVAGGCSHHVPVRSNNHGARARGPHIDSHHVSHKIAPN